MSEHKPPKPVANTFVVCRELFQDQQGKEIIIIGPAVEVPAPQYPFIASMNAFGLFTSLRGSYRLKLQLEDGEGGAVWSHEMPQALQNTDPLVTVQVCFTNLPTCLPKPGKYDMVLLANGEEAARYTFSAALTKQREG